MIFVRRIKYKLTKILNNVVDFFFDLYWRVDTYGVIKPHDLDPGQNFLAKMLSRPYQQSRYLLFHKTISSIAIDSSSFSFIDMGSGKGKALIMACRYDFPAVIGVEFSRELCDIASKNILATSDKSVTQQVSVECLNIVDFNFPRGDMLIYCFNPFDESVMNHVVEKLFKQKMFRPKDQILFVYVNPVYDFLFKNHPNIKLINCIGHWNRNFRADIYEFIDRIESV